VVVVSVEGDGGCFVSSCTVLVLVRIDMFFLNYRDATRISFFVFLDHLHLSSSFCDRSTSLVLLSYER
jgi:hypothetical protein